MQCLVVVFQVTEHNTLVTNVLDVNELYVIDRWTDKQATLIQETTDASGMFFDPMGFILAMTRSNEMK